MCKDVAREIIEIASSKGLSCAIVDSGEYGVFLADVIEDLGFSVYVFTDEKVFEDEYKVKRFDVIILSWDPFWGESAVTSVRMAGEPYPSLIVSSDGGESVSFRLAISPAGFLFRPFDVNRFMETLLKAVEDK